MVSIESAGSNNPKVRSCSSDGVQTCQPDCLRVNTPILELAQNHNPIRLNPVVIGPIKEIPDSVKVSPINNLSSFYHKHLTSVYKSEDNKGINKRGASKAEICLAMYSKEVADEIDTVGACYTGVKYALWSAGVINDYGDMPKGSAHDSLSYFNSHPDRFKKLNVKREDLTKLPAGKIIVYTKNGENGHIAITNGNGQEMSDCTDNMKWLEKQGAGANYTVYELTDGWSYNQQTRKLEFHQPKKK